jgi:SAM-dependent methyltransferase
MYERNPDRFLGEPTRFLRWSLPYLAELGTGLAVIELGCGPGRDAQALSSAGHVVRAVDHSRIAIQRARAGPSRESLRFELSDALTALRGTADSSVDAIYAHALYMLFSEEELDELLREISRALRPGGLHLFAVRSATDPIAARSCEVAPNVWCGGPHTRPYRYYRAESVASFGAGRFQRVATEFEPELHLWYVCDRRP